MPKPVSLQDQRGSIDKSKITLGGAKAFDKLCKNRFNGATILENTHIGDDQSPSLKKVLSDIAATTPANASLVQQFETDLSLHLSPVSISQVLTDYNTIHQALCDALKADPTPPDFDILALPAYLEELKQESLKEVEKIYNQQRQALELFLDTEIAKPNGLLAPNTKHIGGLDPGTVKQKILDSFEENHKKICAEFDGKTKDKDEDSINNAIENVKEFLVKNVIRINVAHELQVEEEKSILTRTLLTQQMEEQRKQAILQKNSGAIANQNKGNDYKGVDISKLKGLKNSCGYPFESLARRLWSHLPLPTSTEPSFEDIVSNTEKLVLQMLASGADPIRLKITLEDQSNQDLAKYLTRVAIAACMRAGVDPSKIVITAPQATSQSDQNPNYQSQVVCGQVSKDKTITAKEAYENTALTSMKKGMLWNTKNYPIKKGWEFEELEKHNINQRKIFTDLSNSGNNTAQIRQEFQNFKRNAQQSGAQITPPGTTTAPASQQGAQASTPGAAANTNTATVSVLPSGTTGATGATGPNSPAP